MDDLMVVVSALKKGFEMVLMLAAVKVVMWAVEWAVYWVERMVDLLEK